MSKAVLSGESLLEVCGWTKGWVCSRGEGSDWLGSYTGPHTKGSVDGDILSAGNMVKISCGVK